jgi:hypothetical protein
MSEGDIDWKALRKSAEAYCRRISRLDPAEFIARLKSTGWPLKKKDEDAIRRAFQSNPCYAFYALSSHEIDIDDINEREPDEVVSESWKTLRAVTQDALPARKPQVVPNDEITLRSGTIERAAEEPVNIPGEIVDLANELLADRSEKRIFMLPPNEMSLPLVFIEPNVWERALEAKLIPDLEVYILSDDED